MNFIIFNIVFMFIYYGLEFVGKKTNIINMSENTMENITPIIVLSITSFILTIIIKKIFLDEYLNGN